MNVLFRYKLFRVKDVRRSYFASEANDVKESTSVHLFKAEECRSQSMLSRLNICAYYIVHLKYYTRATFTQLKSPISSHSYTADQLTMCGRKRK